MDPSRRQIKNTMNQNTKKNNRRTFLKQGGAAIGALTVLPSTSLFAKKAVYDKNGNMVKAPSLTPNEKVDIALIGIGHRGGQISKSLYDTGLCNPVALCDVDMMADHTAGIRQMFPKAKKFQDFRVMFDEAGKEFDAVSVGLPDFAHHAVTMLAMSQGKHVYVEKPLARTFHECEQMMQGEKKYNVVTQMGNQGHSEGNYFQFKAWVEAGIISDVEKITAHMNSKRRWHGWDTSMTAFPKGQPIPSTMDWNTWLMTGMYHEYHKDFHHGQWRCWYEHGMGALGDWGAHIIDTAHEFLSLGLPYEVEPVMLEGHNPMFFPQSSTLKFKFPKRKAEYGKKKKLPACTITWYDGVTNIPELPEGYGSSELASNIPAASTGKIKPAKLNPGKEIYGKKLTFKGGSHGSTLKIIPSDAAQEMEAKGKLPEVPKSPSNHFENFLLACKGEEKTRSPFSVSAPLSQVFCLGVMAQRLNQTIKFDRETKQILNNNVANDLLTDLHPRKEWEEFYKLV